MAEDDKRKGVQVVKILVTGSSGYIGSNLVQLLQSKYEIVPFDLKSGQDVLSPLLLEDAMSGCEQVIHLANLIPLSGKTFDEYFLVNCVGTYNVVKAAIKSRLKRIVYISSTSYYGLEPGVLGCVQPVREDQRVIQMYLSADEIGCYDFQLAYGQSEIIAENILGYYGLRKEIEVVCLRPAALGSVASLWGTLRAIMRAVEEPGPFWYEPFNVARADKSDIVDIMKAETVLGWRSKPKVAVALLTYNRRHFFERTLASLAQAEYPFDLCVVDNGSVDGTAERVRELGGLVNESGNHAVGLGMNLAIGAAMKHDPDLMVFTADDYEYKPGWLRRLVNFWEAAPGDVVLTTCNIEPDYCWAFVTGTLDCGGERALVRNTVPGSNWTFRASDWPIIGPIPEFTGGEDIAVLEKLRKAGKRFCALDLAEHIGMKESAWGNQAWKGYPPLDKKKWGLEK